MNYKQLQSNKLHKILVNNKVIVESNALTLDGLNKIFNQSFTYGHLLVYVDGKLVFNGTVTDDLSAIILDLLEKYIGMHELKVVFTDSYNHTDTYKQNITIR